MFYIVLQKKLVSFRVLGLRGRYIPPYDMNSVFINRVTDNYWQ